MEIKAIQTKYKGYTFRSRLEARWAVFLDALRIRWQYESEGYVLSDGRTYLPDFWLPKVGLRTTEKPAGLFLEVKGVDYEELSDAYTALLGDFVVEKKAALIVLSGGLVQSGNERHDFYQFEYCPTDYGSVSWDNCMLWCKCYKCKLVKIEFCEGSYMKCEHCGSKCDDEHPDIRQAVDKARSARFEHGETPCPR